MAGRRDRRSKPPPVRGVAFQPRRVKNSGPEPLTKAGAGIPEYFVEKVPGSPRRLTYAADDDTRPETETLIMCAAGGGDVDTIKALVAADRSLLEHEDESGQIPLSVASQFGQLLVVRTLLSLGSPVDHINLFGDTPLLIACRAGYLGVVTALVDAKANVNFRTESGDTPLFRAARFDHVEVVRFLCQRGAKANPVDDMGWNPVLAATDRGHVETLKELLRRGGDAKHVSKAENYPLLRALELRHDEPARLLKGRGAQIMSKPTSRK